MGLHEVPTLQGYCYTPSNQEEMEDVTICDEISFDDGHFLYSCPGSCQLYSLVSSETGMETFEGPYTHCNEVDKTDGASDGPTNGPSTLGAGALWGKVIIVQSWVQ